MQVFSPPFRYSVFFGVRPFWRANKKQGNKISAEGACHTLLNAGWVHRERSLYPSTKFQCDLSELKPIWFELFLALNLFGTLKRFEIICRKNVLQVISVYSEDSTKLKFFNYPDCFLSLSKITFEMHKIRLWFWLRFKLIIDYKVNEWIAQQTLFV